MSIDATRPGGAASRMALARHELPDGTWHFDWFIERPGVRTERRLRTFRVMRDPAGVGPGTAFEAEAIADHRAVYLNYSGPVPQDRGRVDLVWTAGCVVEQMDDRCLRVWVVLDGGERLFDGAPAGGAVWGIRRADPEAGGP